MFWLRDVVWGLWGDMVLRLCGIDVGIRVCVKEGSRREKFEMEMLGWGMGSWKM